MKNVLILLFSVVLLAGCNQDKNANRPGEPVSEGVDTVPRDFTRDVVEEDRDNTETEDEDPRALQTPLDHEFAGQYRKTESDNSRECQCDCLTVSFTTASEVCIAPDKMYVSAKFVKTDSNNADMFLVEPTNVQNADDDLPWEEFDRDTPIATLSLEPDGTVTVDWKGFAIDGEVVTDYAIYGKKTLEGTYQRE